MQAANGFVTVRPGHVQAKYNVTPAEAVILHKLHVSESKGVPLSDFVIVGEATTQLGSRRAKAQRENLEGDKVEVEISEPILRKRTQQDEIQRLARAYPGTVRVGKQSFQALEACFPGPVKRLPETFEEIEASLNLPAGFFKRQTTKESSQKAELMEKSKADLIAFATELGIEVVPGENKNAIANKIVAAS